MVSDKQIKQTAPIRRRLSRWLWLTLVVVLLPMIGWWVFLNCVIQTGPRLHRVAQLPSRYSSMRMSFVRQKVDNQSTSVRGESRMVACLEDYPFFPDRPHLRIIGENHPVYHWLPGGWGRVTLFRDGKCVGSYAATVPLSVYGMEKARASLCRLPSASFTLDGQYLVWRIDDRQYFFATQ